MNYYFVSHVSRALTCFSRRQMHKTIENGTKMCSFLINTQNLTLKRRMCCVPENKGKYEDSTTNLGTVNEIETPKDSPNASIDSSEMVTFFVKDSKTHIVHEVKARIGENIMECSADCGVNVAGACGGKLACSTCMMYLDDELWNVFGDPKQDEEDTLDKAALVKYNSRLTCQLEVCKGMEGRTFTLPLGTVNMAVDGYQFEKH